MCLMSFKKAVQNSNSPYMGVALAVMLVVIIAIGIWAIIKAKEGDDDETL